MSISRRKFLQSLAAGLLGGGSPLAAASSDDPSSRREEAARLAEAALDSARTAGAGYADLRVLFTESELLSAREERIENVEVSTSSGLGVRVLVNGVWGFSSTSVLDPAHASACARNAVEVAKANRVLATQLVELESIEAKTDRWRVPTEQDPFAIPLDRKAEQLLKINAEARAAGAPFCRSFFLFVRQEKFFASSRGSFLEQLFFRTYPHLTVTATDPKTGRFASRSSLLPPRAAGFEYVLSHDWKLEARQAAEDARRKLQAKPVTAGKKDLVIHPTNLWLTLHETIGHSTELDRAFGYEAGFAGTTFVKPSDRGRLRFASEIVTVMADRDQPGGLATAAYDDDGMPARFARFPIISRGRFENFQMAIGQSRWIGLPHSNACSFAEGHAYFPIQRMPNISLQPSERDVSLEELIAGVEDGIYIVGDGSWSIDQQRKNFQFGGQLFYEIRKGKLGEMLRDVAYQGTTVPFWNACDGLGGAKEYWLGGTLSCGKGQPVQSAPVSHGVVPARFRGIHVLNTGRGA
ncbi:TldD protein [Methylacidimicrobium cyclopophantes]|uniref:TldD protein n=1 Tax=Methylacidimicrobium cyclopophantes TaxID=1041766 RepID=A0A5E6MKK2_9BACT|nr:TldD/PmbA family protein [Methylacidimicrobium cyclopophantes]VVM08508.1 TldD protein [Methylacidimicrobium cyclopophantes]